MEYTKNDFNYELEVKEVMNDSILHPSHIGREMSKKEIIDFFGLNEPDIEWYKIYWVYDGVKHIM